MHAFFFILLAFLYSNLSPSVGVKCNNSELIVHSNGRDYPGCGSSVDNACGTLYYASFYNNCTSFVQIYGQNVSQIEVYYNEAIIEYHPCLIVPLSQINSSFLSTFTYINLRFDSEFIGSMTDWYPSICHDISISGKFNNDQQKYLFQFDGTMTVFNLHIDNIIFNRDIDLFPKGIYYSESSMSTFSCYEGCSFANISAVCTDQQHNSIIHGAEVLFSNALFINISYENSNCSSSSFINTTGQNLFNEIGQSNLSHIFTDHNFVTTQRGVISIDNVIISNMHCKHAFIQDIIPHNPILKLPQHRITATNINNFHGNSLYVALSLEYGTELVVTDSYISYQAANKHYDNTTSSLFNFGDGHLLLDNVIIEYHYDLSENCINASDHFEHDFIVAECVNPLPIIISYGQTLIDGLQLYFEVNYNEYERAFYNTSDGSVINYRFNNDDFGNGLIINYGDMKLNNLTVSPFTFHNTFILDLGILFSIKLFNVIDNDANYNWSSVLTSNYLYYYTENDVSYSDSSNKPIKSFTSCDLGNVKDTVIVIDAIQQSITLSVYNSSISNALKAIIINIFSHDYGVNTSSVIVDSCNFKNIGHHYLDLYGYYYGYNTSNFSIIYSGSYGAVYTEKTNSPIFIHRVYTATFRNCILDFYNNYHLLNLVDVDIANLHSNIFSCSSDENILWDASNTVLIMNQSLVNIYYNSNYYLSSYHSIISNTFSNTSYLNENTSSLSISNANTACLTGNIFYNYGLYVATTTKIISCYRPNARVISQFCGDNNQTMCCNHIGGLIPDLSNVFGYFYLDHAYANPIQSSTAWFAVQVTLDNIVFVLLGDRDSIFYPEMDVFTAKDVDLLFYDTKIVYKNNFQYKLTSNYYDNSNRCTVGCNQQLAEYDENHEMNVDYFKQIVIVCSDNKYRLNSSTEWVTHSIPSHIDIIPNGYNYEYFPGQSMILKMEITDRLHNIIEEYTAATMSSSDALILNLYYKDEFNTDLATGIVLESNNSYKCTDIICVEGLILSDITLENIGIVSIYGQELSQTLNVFDLSLNVTHCGAGYKISSTGLYCAECPKGEFSLSGVSKTCYLCDEDINDGITCNGGNRIVIQQHYWMDIVPDHDEYDKYVIVTGFCPNAYCCNDENGCNYYQNIHNDTYSGSPSQLCAPNRDFNVPLCGSCNVGYSQSINSNSCVYCDGDNLWYLLYPILLALLFSAFLIVPKSIKCEIDPKDEIITKEENADSSCCTIAKCIEENKEKISAEQFKIFMRMNGVMISKIILYYQQSVSQILLSSVVVINLSTLSSLFNLSIISTANNKGFCFIDGLNSKGKILADLFVTAFIIFIILSLYILSKFKEIKIKNRTPNFPKTFVAFLLLTIGQILSILFKLLNCQSVGTGDNAKYVHFYFGIEECYGVTWTLSLLSLIAIILVFIVLFFVIKKMDPSLRGNEEKNSLILMTDAYKKEYYYWEFVLLFRRILIAFLSITFNNDYLKWFLILSLIILLGVQTKCKPFLYKEINEMEWILLACLILIISVLLISSSSLFVMVIVSLLIIFPFLLAIYFQYAFFSKFKENDHLKENDHFTEYVHVEKTAMAAADIAMAHIAASMDIDKMDESEKLYVE